ncbi:peptidoglycan-binding domain-containing protein [Streptomyces huasconensis]|uniref:peptidoglycan-binding domain-containing protein n=2 Tax=Streptomyces huasconensis TaxID=1854574 RepID=UPI003703112D
MTGHDGRQGGRARWEGSRCAECGAARAADGSPLCGCARRAADTASRTRSAEAAAAEDFDPLRIRPYVSLPDPEATAPLPRPLAATAFTASPDPTADPPEHPAPAENPDPAETLTAHRGRARRRRRLLLGGACAVAAVTAGTVFTTGLFSSAADRPTRDRALPGASAAEPAGPTEPAPPSAKPSASPTPRPPAVTPRGTTPPPAPTRSAPPPSPSRPSSPPPSTARATGSVDATPPRGPTGAATLSQGDRGPEVTELQGRLAQLYLYVGERDGSYTRQVTAAVLRYQWARGLTSDEPGAYGRQTRRSLESETREP